MDQGPGTDQGPRTDEGPRPKDQGPSEGVSFVVPVRNGARLIAETLKSIAAQADGRPLELIVVDDGSEDETWEVLGAFRQRLEESMPVTMMRCDGVGAAAAINAGVALARYPIVCQVDQDVRIHPGWLRVLCEAFADPMVGAAQGWYATDPGASICSRVMGLDLEQRYVSISGETDHVCTGNTAYRTEALRRVGLFDESMGYGYDNDMSYRLRAAGYRLKFCPGARAFHRWRDGLVGYVVQQYGFGYGRIDIVAKHRRRFTGDRVSPAIMMLHPVVMLLALCAFAAAVSAGALGLPAGRLFGITAVLIGALIVERLSAAGRAVGRFRDRAAWLFPLLHLVRDLAWVAAIVVWVTRLLRGRPRQPSHSMQPRPIRLLIASRGGRPTRRWRRRSLLQTD